MKTTSCLSRLWLAVLLGWTVLSAVPAQTVLDDSNYWLYLERGKRAFRAGAYGEALLSFEDARRSRASYYDDAHAALVKVLSATELRVFGDDLNTAVAYLRSWKLIPEAVELLIQDPVSLASNSLNKALQQLREARNYPEAEYWIAEVFRAEGEYSISISQYLKALSYHRLLDIPDEVREIRYALANVYAKTNQYNAMEAVLLTICADDYFWASQEQAFTRAAMSKILASEGVNRFLLLYRHEAFQFYQAHRDLGLYYYKAGRHDRAVDHLSFAFLLESTLIIEELRRRDPDWRFAWLVDAWNRALADKVMREQIASSNYFQTCYYLGAALFAVGKRLPANSLWRFTATVLEAGEWRIRSEKQLQAPFIEETVPL